MDTYNLSEFASFRGVRQIAGGAILLLALTLAGPPRLCGQRVGGPPSNSTISSVLVSPGSVTGARTDTFLKGKVFESTRIIQWRNP